MDKKANSKSQETAKEVDILCEVCGRFVPVGNMGYCKGCRTYHCGHCASVAIRNIRQAEHLAVWNG